MYQKNPNNWGWATGSLQSLEKATSERATEWA
jgi:hypothetical protein